MRYKQIKKSVGGSVGRTTRRIIRAMAGGLLVGALCATLVPHPASAQGLGEDERTLQAGDMLRITIWPNADLGGEFEIEDSGSAYLPLLGEVRAAGVPLEELRARLRRGYADAMQNPVVSVTPVFQISVTGQVRQPGVFFVTPTSTLFDVIGRAGGFTGGADQEDVRVVRGASVVEVNALRALEEGYAAYDLQLRSGDQIVVPEASGFNWGRVVDVLQVAATVGLVIERLGR